MTTMALQGDDVNLHIPSDFAVGAHHVPAHNEEELYSLLFSGEASSSSGGGDDPSNLLFSLFTAPASSQHTSMLLEEASGGGEESSTNNSPYHLFYEGSPASSPLSSLGLESSPFPTPDPSPPTFLDPSSVSSSSVFTFVDAHGGSEGGDAQTNDASPEALLLELDQAFPFLVDDSNSFGHSSSSSTLLATNSPFSPSPSTSSSMTFSSSSASATPPSSFLPPQNQPRQRNVPGVILQLTNPLFPSSSSAASLYSSIPSPPPSSSGVAAASLPRILGVDTPAAQPDRKRQRPSSPPSQPRQPTKKEQKDGAQSIMVEDVNSSGSSGGVGLSREELLTFSSEDMENYVQKLKQQRKLSKEEDKMLKKQRRLIKNREYAQQARKKKKTYVNELEETVQQLKARNEELEAEVVQLNGKLSTVSAENRQLRGAMLQIRAKLRAQSSSSSSNWRFSIGNKTAVATSAAASCLLAVLFFGLFFRFDLIPSLLPQDSASSKYPTPGSGRVLLGPDSAPTFSPDVEDDEDTSTLSSSPPEEKLIPCDENQDCYLPPQQNKPELRPSDNGVDEDRHHRPPPLPVHQDALLTNQRNNGTVSEVAKEVDKDVEEQQQRLEAEDASSATQTSRGRNDEDKANVVEEKRKHQKRNTSPSSPPTSPSPQN